jgi:flagellar protein FlgJ
MPAINPAATVAGNAFDLPALVQSGGPKADTPENIRHAASQFEALMIGQMLKSAQEGNSGDFMGTDDDQSGSSLLEMAQQQFAQAMAAQGGLGLAKMISEGLSAKR